MQTDPILRHTKQILDQRLPVLAQNLGSRHEDLSPASFRGFLSGLKDVLHEIGRHVFVQLLEQLDDHDSKALREGDRVFHYKETYDKKWFTPFGRVVVERRYYQQGKGDRGRFPLDERIGMKGCYFTPDLQEQVAFGVALIPALEVRRLLAKMLPETPSVKAIQRVIEDVGDFADEQEEVVEAAIRQHAPLSMDGDILVASIDGTHAPLRNSEDPDEATPSADDGEQDGEKKKKPVRWKEVGVATVSIYQPPDADHEVPTRVDHRILGRMPEPKMKRLFNRQTQLLTDLAAERTFREIVFLCDGSRAIWKRAEEDPFLSTTTQVLDFFHAAEHLAKARDAVFGDKSLPGQRWFKKYREILQTDTFGLAKVIRSLRYYRTQLTKGSKRRKIVGRVIAHFTRNRDRMRYFEFLCRGLPIGSGPVEAACKTLVGARLKRSGMRWTHPGGQRVLHLRAHYLSNRWDTFWSAYETRQTG